MNIRINKHRDDVTRVDAIQVCQQFQPNIAQLPTPRGDLPS